MSNDRNALRWDGTPGHYEVYYLSATDRASGVGLWIRYTMVAPLPATGEPGTCALWVMAMDPGGQTLGRKETFPIERLASSETPFELRVADAVLSDSGMSGAFGDVAWDVSWQPSERSYDHVHASLQATRVAKTVLTLPHADVAVSGTLQLAGRELQLDGARGGQAHLWGSKHANRWAWAHCNDFETIEGEPAPNCFVDGVSVYVPRFGREVGPNTPVVGRFNGRDFYSTSPLRVTRNPSQFGLTSWSFEAVGSGLKLVGEVVADRDQLVGVTYHDPDGDLAYCYNAETASMQLGIWERARQHFGGWRLSQTLVAPGRAHFEYAQRDPVEGLELQIA